jgi:hypothetical protein
MPRQARFTQRIKEAELDRRLHDGKSSWDQLFGELCVWLPLRTPPALNSPDTSNSYTAPAAAVRDNAPPDPRSRT